MPKIDQPKKIKKTKKLTKLSNKIKSSKPTSVDYYNCLLTSAQQDWIDSTTGKKKKITACCKDCKTNAPALNKQRELELNKLITSYRQVGECLSKLLKPLK